MSSPAHLSDLCSDIVLEPGLTVSALEFALQDVPFLRCLSYYGRASWDDLQDSPPPFDWKRVEVGRRMKWDDFIFAMPPKSFVVRWRKDSGINRRRTRPEAAEPSVQVQRRPLLELPPKKVRKGANTSPEVAAGPNPRDSMDPIKMVDAVSCSLKLRQVEEFSDALDDATRYNHSGDDDPPVRDRTADPSRTTIERAKARLDTVGMNIERRIFAEEMAEDSIEAISCYSDASPVVGAEIQGMLVDFIHRDGSVRKTTLPGSTLQYSKCDAINKTLAFVWAAWLVCGPLLAGLEYFFSHVISMTTDFGVESHTLSVPWVLPAFMAWVDGRPLEECAHLIDFNRRLFGRALRIAGWNHCCANIMKRVAKIAPTWPQIIAAVCQLCTFSAIRHGENILLCICTQGLRVYVTL